MYEKLRAEYGPLIPIELEPGVNAWIVTDYQTLVAWSRDTSNFSYDPRNWKDFREGRVAPDFSLLQMMAPRPNALYVDGVEHQRYRRALSDSLGAVRETYLSEITERYAGGLIDRFCEQGTVDLVDQYARLLPILVLNELFGFDEDQGLRFAGAMRKVVVGVDAERANAEAERALSEVVAAKHANPGEDLTSRLIGHRSALTDEEVIQQMRLMMAWGVETVLALTCASVRAALTGSALSPGRAPSRTALAELVDRVLWESPPITNFPAVYPRVDIPVGGGRVIDAGTPILLGLAAANHFYRLENAERLEEAPNRAHLAWGAGPHRCPARDEATVITIVALRTLFERLPDLGLAVPPQELRWYVTNLASVFVDLPVRFTPTSRRSPEETKAPLPSEGGRPSSVLSSLSDFLVRLLRGS
ncbi:cytochrome P450 [Nocardiopsis sp. CNT312]|uniref:cytochrome P450 n=1 Tax=Nocardiopsis sp. CNT312 TaxID=1137268 RepID=UPI00048E0DAA|nr:cytochrome P450 [Nocardiopsis sp. CNT312]